MGVPKGAGNLRGARDKNWTVVAACLRSFRRALTAVHPEPARGPTLVTSATQLKIGEPCEFSANHENRPEFLDVTLQSRPTENGVSPPLLAQGQGRTRGVEFIEGIDKCRGGDPDGLFASSLATGTTARARPESWASGRASTVPSPASLSARRNPVVALSPRTERLAHHLLDHAGR